ncbi:unnamed protein product [Prorocentrum cordatum]|uniref:SGF29 C-terminal domain-containing protein n=1 Tax=Prorocentrum cordatum TaxID=2364126 RepID=A0ABN9QSX7_9DINO|nr:unnamed protein product [Polarella glacialis]
MAVDSLLTRLGCKRRSDGLALLGIPDEYVWEGLGDEEIDAYYEAKEKALDQLELTDADQFLQEVELMQRVPAATIQQLKDLLIHRAVRLVHVLKPIEEQRKGMRSMQSKGYLTPSHVSSFEHAEELCQKELQSIMEESQLLVPGSPRNAIREVAARMYHQRLAEVEQGGDNDQPKFEDMKSGFLKSTPSSEPPARLAHGFPIGAEVEAHGLQTQAMNGARGRVKGVQKQRVAVVFPPPLGDKALLPANLRLVAASPPIHPDAVEAPSLTFQVCLHHSKGEPLGIRFEPQPPPEQQAPDQQSWLLVTGFHEKSQAERHNATQKDPDLRLRQGDRIVAVVDASVPDAERKPVGGNFRAILAVMASGKSPLVFFVQRVLGPPLRFKVGQCVKATCGDKGWLDGQVIAVWDTDSKGKRVPYVIRIPAVGNDVCAPADSDQFIKKGDPRFKVGDAVVANYQGGYKKGTVIEVLSERTHSSYRIRLEAGGECTAPDDLNKFVRPVARFEKGAEVLVNNGSEYLPATVEAVYHPGWTYLVKLDGGNLVPVPHDVDQIIKAR